MGKNECPEGDANLLDSLAADLERIEQIKSPGDLETQDAIDNFRTVLSFATDPYTPERAKAQIQKHVVEMKGRVNVLLSTLDPQRLDPAIESA